MTFLRVAAFGPASLATSQDGAGLGGGGGGAGLAWRWGKICLRSMRFLGVAVFAPASLATSQDGAGLAGEDARASKAPSGARSTTRTWRIPSNPCTSVA